MSRPIPIINNSYNKLGHHEQVSVLIYPFAEENTSFGIYRVNYSEDKTFIDKIMGKKSTTCIVTNNHFTYILDYNTDNSKETNHIASQFTGSKLFGPVIITDTNRHSPIINLLKKKYKIPYIANNLYSIS